MGGGDRGAVASAAAGCYGSANWITGGTVAADVTETVAGATPARSGRGRWVAVIIVAVLAAVYLGAIASTHAALSGGFVGWSGGFRVTARGWPRSPRPSRHKLGPHRA